MLSGIKSLCATVAESAVNKYEVEAGHWYPRSPTAFCKKFLKVKR